MEAVSQTDAEVFLWLNGWVGTSPIFDRLVQWMVSDYLIPVVFSVVLLGLWFGWADQAMRERHQRGVMLAGISVGIANVMVKISNAFYFRPRPFDSIDVELLFYPPHRLLVPSQSSSDNRGDGDGCVDGEQAYGRHHVHGCLYIWFLKGVLRGFLSTGYSRGCDHWHFGVIPGLLCSQAHRASANPMPQIGQIPLCCLRVSIAKIPPSFLGGTGKPVQLRRFILKNGLRDVLHHSAGRLISNHLGHCGDPG